MTYLDNPIVFLLFWVAMWCAICLTLSVWGGWYVLAKYYRATQPFSGKLWHFRSASFFRNGAMRPSSYGGCLTFGASTEGLYISTMLPFRLGHPPLFVPWSDIGGIETYHQLFLSAVRFRFKKVPFVACKISNGLATAVSQESHGHFSVGNS
jgi:hypothetical protein